MNSRYSSQALAMKSVDCVVPDPPPYQQYDNTQGDSALSQAVSRVEAALQVSCERSESSLCPPKSLPITSTAPHEQTCSSGNRSRALCQHDNIHEGWNFCPKSGGYACWTRKMHRDNDQIWYQYGISREWRDSSDAKPDVLFTCMMEPRKPGNEKRIQEICLKIAQNMRSHKGATHKYDKCSCTFETMRTTWWGCDAFRPRRIATGKLVQRGMREHDRYCSCVAFSLGANRSGAELYEWTHWSKQWGCIPCWSRIIKHGDNTSDIWFQDGISKTWKGKAEEQEPDIFFTCKAMPRDATVTMRQIGFLCQVVSQDLRKHRGPNYDKCSCDFENLCTRAYLVKEDMRDHDKICSCGCFDKALSSK